MDEDLIRRITRLEEAHAFSEHTADQLGHQLAEAHRMIDRLAARIGALEHRLREQDAAKAADDTDADEPALE